MGKKVTAVKKAVAWSFKPFIRITLITNEEKAFLIHANKFLENTAIKPEHRNKD